MLTVPRLYDHLPTQQMNYRTLGAHSAISVLVNIQLKDLSISGRMSRGIRSCATLSTSLSSSVLDR